MKHIRENFSIALLSALGPTGHTFGDGLAAGQWMTEAVRGNLGTGEAGAVPPQAQNR
jgi:hypothetical protein